MTPTAPTDQHDDGTDTTTATDDDAATTATDTRAEQTATPTDNGDDGHGEAARYRRRLRDTESDLAGLTARVDRIETAHVERLAAARLADGSDLLALGGVDLDALRGDDGEIDDQLVEQAVTALLTARPGFAKPPRLPGFDGGQRTDITTPPADWQKLLRGR